jgi:simple sugar transport system permease protein
MNSLKVKDHVEVYLVVLLLLIIVVFSTQIPGVFWSASNFQSIGSQLPVLGVLAFAMAVTMLTGGINLSIIATTNCCALVMAWVATHFAPSAGSALLMLLAGIGMALVIGLLNGILIAVIRVSPILATLGTMTLLKGITILISKGTAISNFPAYVLWLNSNNWLGIPVPLYLFALVAIVMWIVLERSPLGRRIYLIGSNQRAAHYSGINTPRTLMATYIISSLLCLVAALMMMSKLNSAKAGYGESFLLTSILAAVLGGVNPDGGFGKIVGMVLALILLQMLESGLNIMGISSYITMALWGGLLLAFLFLKGGRLPYFGR